MKNAKSLNMQEGYTLLETLTALAVLAMVMGALAFGTSRVIKTTGTYMGQLSVTRIKYSAARALDASLRRITLPYWEVPDISAGPAGSSISIPWYDGKRESFLGITFTGQVLELSLDSPEEGNVLLAYIEGLESVRIETVNNEVTGHATGIRVSMTTGKNRKDSFAWTGYFASRSAVGIDSQ